MASAVNTFPASLVLNESARSGSSVSFLKTPRQFFDNELLTQLTTLIAFMGVLTNITNIMVFYRQGFKSTVNIGLAGLAVSDLCGLLTLPWYNPIVYLSLPNSAANIFSTEVKQLTSGFPHACFTRITAWITVLLTAERCACIWAPLTFKGVITTRRVTLTVCSIYVLMIASLLPEYTTAYLDWKFYPSFNLTLVGLVVTANRKYTEGLSFLLYAVYVLVSFPSVICFTSVLVAKLAQRTNKRAALSHDRSQNEAISRRNKKTINMVAGVACVFIVTFVPTFVICLHAFVQLSNTPTSNDLMWLAVSVMFAFDALNASVNIVTYYTMSSRYRLHFHTLVMSTPLCRLTSYLPSYRRTELLK